MIIKLDKIYRYLVICERQHLLESPLKYALIAAFINRKERTGVLHAEKCKQRCRWIYKTCRLFQFPRWNPSFLEEDLRRVVLHQNTRWKDFYFAVVGFRICCVRGRKAPTIRYMAAFESHLFLAFSSLDQISLRTQHWRCRSNFCQRQTSTHFALLFVHYFWIYSFKWQAYFVYFNFKYIKFISS